MRHFRFPEVQATGAQTQAVIDEETVEQIVVTGTRVADRSALETAVPVDVVSSDALKNLGVSEVNQALSVALPSYNFPRPGLADGTDTVRGRGAAAVDLNTIPNAIVNTIEVRRDGASAQ